MGPFKCYVMKMGVGGVSNVLEKKRYEGVRFNVISVTRGWVWVQFPGKKRYLTLEWPQCSYIYVCTCIRVCLLWCMCEMHIESLM